MTTLFSGNDDYESIPLLDENDQTLHDNNHHHLNSLSESATTRRVMSMKKPILFTILFVVAFTALFNTLGPSFTELPAKRTIDENPPITNHTPVPVINIKDMANVTMTDEIHMKDGHVDDLIEKQLNSSIPSINAANETISNEAIQNVLDSRFDEVYNNKLEEDSSDQDIIQIEPATIINMKGDNNGKKRRANRGRGKKNGGKKASKGDNDQPQFDLSALRNAIRTNDKNPFKTDFSAIIHGFEKNNTQIIGDLDTGIDYSTRKFRTHLGHAGDSNDLELYHALRFFHISDTHIDAFFNPYTSSQQGVCSSCKLNSKIYGENAYCPLQTPFEPNAVNVASGYAFGRFRCNPPPALLASLLSFIRHHQRSPSFFLLTGDIGAHGMASDNNPINPDSKLTDFCPTKFIGMRETLKMFRELFPHTPILFAPGNNDHLPKNVVWTPYFEAMAALLVEFDMLHPSQAATFSRIGSHFVDLEVDNEKYKEFIHSEAAKIQNSGKKHNETTLGSKDVLHITHGLDDIPSTTMIRVILPDMTLLAPGGEASFVPEEDYADLEGLERENVQFPRRAELVAFLNQTLFDAEKQKRYCLIGGHQPMSTKKGQNELLLTTTTHGLLVKALFAQYAHIIKGAFFGHRNLASISNILDPSGAQVVPQLVVPGLSPRGNNLPSIQEVSMSRSSGTILDFEQFVFDLMEENERAQLIATNPNFVAQNTNNTLLADTYSDSSRVIVHEVISSRINDKYDPEAYQKHLQSTEHKNEEAAVGTLTPGVLRHGVDCGSDEELCEFLKKWGYVGTFVKNNEVSSWRKMTGYNAFTAQTVAQMNARVPTSGRLFTAIQVMKRAGFIGDMTPENVFCNASYDDESMMMSCLFPEQDVTEGCFAKSWLK